MPQSYALNGKSIIITGAASGIGAAAAMRAGQMGALLTLADVNEAAGLAVVERIEAAGGKAQFVRTDISDEMQVEAMVEAALERFRSLDGAFNNAGVPGYSHRPGHAFTRLADMQVEAFHHGIGVNVFGTFLCMKHEIRAMLRCGGGSIINTASAVSVMAIPGSSDYIAAKHAIVGLTKSGALDYAADNIRINAVLPGGVRTPMLEGSATCNPGLLERTAGMHPIKRLGEPVEVGETALWLLSDAASFVTGMCMPVDGGLTVGFA